MKSLTGGVTCTTLLDGQILAVAVGTTPGKVGCCEIYNPTTASWNSITWPHDTEFRTNTRLTTLSNGSAMLAGGYDGIGVPNVNLYEPSTGEWIHGAPMLYGRWTEGLVTLPSGDVLAIGGGHAPRVGVKTVEMLDIKDETWNYTTELPETLFAMGTAVMSNGSVFVAGGRTSGSPGVTSAAFIYTGNKAAVDYRCEANACVQVPAGGGVPREECETFCGAPIEKYECVGGRCSRSVGGVDKSVCEQICKPADASPFMV